MQFQQFIMVQKRITTQVLDLQTQNKQCSHNHKTLQEIIDSNWGVFKKMLIWHFSLVERDGTKSTERVFMPKHTFTHIYLWGKSHISIHLNSSNVLHKETHLVATVWCTVINAQQTNYPRNKAHDRCHMQRKISKKMSGKMTMFPSVETDANLIMTN